MTITAEPESIACVGTRDIRLCVIEVARDNQVEITIAVHVVDGDGLCWGDLRRIG